MHTGCSYRGPKVISPALGGQLTTERNVHQGNLTPCLFSVDFSKHVAHFKFSKVPHTYVSSKIKFFKKYFRVLHKLFSTAI